MDAPGLYTGNVKHHHRRRRGHGDDQPYHSKDEEARQRDQLKHQRVQGRKCRTAPNATRNMTAETLATIINPMSMVRCKT
jgi:hypothetical protein